MNLTNVVRSLIIGPLATLFIFVMLPARLPMSVLDQRKGQVVGPVACMLIWTVVLAWWGMRSQIDWFNLELWQTFAIVFTYSVTLLCLASGYVVYKHGALSKEDVAFDAALMKVFGIDLFKKSETYMRWSYSLVAMLPAICVVAAQKFMMSSEAVLKCKPINGTYTSIEVNCDIVDQRADLLSAAPIIGGNAFAMYGLIQMVATYLIKSDKGCEAVSTTMEGWSYRQLEVPEDEP